MFNAIATIARFTLTEGLRTRLPWIALGLLAAMLLAAEFSAGLAITESQSYRVVVYAALTRLAFALLVMLFVATSAVRELSDRMLDLTLSRPVSRASWYLGRLAGFCGLAVGLAAAAAIPLALIAAPDGAAIWGISFAAELCLVAAASLTCVVTLRQVTLVVTATLGFYVLARVIDALVLMSRGPTTDPTAWQTEVIASGVAGLAWLLPALDRFTQSAWLLPAALVEGFGEVLLQAAVYTVFLAAIGLFDLYRLND